MWKGLETFWSGVQPEYTSLVPTHKGQLYKDWRKRRILYWVTTEFPIHSAALLSPNSMIMRFQVFFRL